MPRPPVPDTLDEVLTPAWMTAALAARFPGIQVTAVRRGPVVSRVSTNARFTIECSGGVPAGLSSHLCVKGFFGELAVLARAAGRPEACFYRDLAASCRVRTLRCVHADVDARTGQGVVVTEDVVAQGGAFVDPLDGSTPDQVAESLEQLAVLHGATWSQARLAGVPWLAARLANTLAHCGLAEIGKNFDGPIGARVPVEVRDADRLVGAYRELAATTCDERPWTVIHGDAHVGNVFRDGAGRPGFADWQLVQRGPWYLDVGYHLASSLTVDDRRRCERDLVRHYLERLAASGVDAPSWDDAWLGVRRGIVHGFFLWGITLQVDPAITTELLARLGTAAADADSFAAVGS